jgi:hypothetical protein
MMRILTIRFTVLVTLLASWTDALSVVQPTSAATTPKNNNHGRYVVERMTCEEYRQARQQQPQGALERPILITDALSVQECEELCDEWFQAVGQQSITIQRKIKDDDDGTSSETFLYDCTVEDSLNLLMQSTPSDSIFAFVEGLLECNNNQQMTSQNCQTLKKIQSHLNQVRESLFPGEENWFDYFPKTAQPSDCIVMAGEGGTSTLHRDPFEWTGTNLCLEGRKLWRFLPHDSHYWDDRLDCYRLKSIAWNNNGNIEETATKKSTTEELTLSSGWQSDYSLYTPTGSDLLSAKEISELSEQDSETLLDQMVSTISWLSPNVLPHDDNKGDSACVMDEECFASVVQHTGEMLLIPPTCYHQTYAPEPSIAVASQRCGSSLDASRVIHHILDHQQKPHHNNEPLPTDIYNLCQGRVSAEDLDPKETVRRLFEYLESIQKK